MPQKLATSLSIANKLNGIITKWTAKEIMSKIGQIVRQIWDESIAS